MEDSTELNNNLYLLQKENNELKEIIKIETEFSNSLSNNIKTYSELSHNSNWRSVLNLFDKKHMKLKREREILKKEIQKKPNGMVKKNREIKELKQIRFCDGTKINNDKQMSQSTFTTLWMTYQNSPFNMDIKQDHPFNMDIKQDHIILK